MYRFTYLNNRVYFVAFADTAQEALDIIINKHGKATYHFYSKELLTTAKVNSYIK